MKCKIFSGSTFYTFFPPTKPPKPPTFVRLPLLLCLGKRLPESETCVNLILVLLTISKMSETAAIFGMIPPAYDLWSCL